MDASEHAAAPSWAPPGTTEPLQGIGAVRMRLAAARKGPHDQLPDAGSDYAMTSSWRSRSLGLRPLIAELRPAALREPAPTRRRVEHLAQGRRPGPAYRPRALCPTQDEPGGRGGPVGDDAAYPRLGEPMRRVASFRRPLRVRGAGRSPRSGRRSPERPHAGRPRRWSAVPRSSTSIPLDASSTSVSWPPPRRLALARVVSSSASARRGSVTPVHGSDGARGRARALEGDHRGPGRRPKMRLLASQMGRGLGRLPPPSGPRSYRCLADQSRPPLEPLSRAAADVRAARLDGPTMRRHRRSRARRRSTIVVHPVAGLGQEGLSPTPNARIRIIGSATRNRVSPMKGSTCHHGSPWFPAYEPAATEVRMSVGKTPSSRKPSLNENRWRGVLELAHPLRRLRFFALEDTYAAPRATSSTRMKA